MSVMWRSIGLFAREDMKAMDERDVAISLACFTSNAVMLPLLDLDDNSDCIARRRRLH